MAPMVSAAREDLEVCTRGPVLAAGQAGGVHNRWDRYCAPGGRSGTLDVALQQPRCVTSIVGFGVRVGGLELVAGGQHGETADHAVHVEAVRGAGTRLLARLG